MQPPQAGRASHRHLPAGQSIHGGGGGGGGPASGGGGAVGGAGAGAVAPAGAGLPADMNSGHGSTGSRRRLPQAPTYHAYPPQMINYPPYQYYPGIIPPPNGYPNGLPAPPYMYAPPYSRQPPQTQFVHMAGVTVSGNYNRHSPALSTPYQPPPPVAQSIPPHTPSSTHSAHAPPPPLSPPAPQSTQALPASPAPEEDVAPLRPPFRAPVSDSGSPPPPLQYLALCPHASYRMLTFYSFPGSHTPTNPSPIE